MTDYELARAYSERGDREAIGALIGRYVDVVYGAALRQVRDRQAAEDVTQGVFLLLLQKVGGFGAGVHVGSWLLQATYYACLRAARDLRRREYHERKAAGERREEAVGEGAGDRAWVDGALRKLRERDREAVVLRFMRGLALAEVGAELGISEEAARKRVDRAVEKLRGLAPAEAGAMGIGVVIAEAAVRAPEGVLAKAMAQVGGSVGAGTAATCAGWAGTGFVMAKVKVAAAVLVAVMGASAGAVVLPQVVGGGAARPTVAATGPVKAEAARNDLALACWGAIVSEDVAEALWRQTGGTGDQFVPRTPIVDQASGKKLGRGNLGVGRADAVRGVLRQAMEDGEEMSWVVWAPAVNRIAKADGKFRFDGPGRNGQPQYWVEGPAGKYRQVNDALVLDKEEAWKIGVNPTANMQLSLWWTDTDPLKPGDAAVEMIQAQGSAQWLVVVYEPWRTPYGSSVQHTAESFPNPELWVRNGPAMAAKLYEEADRMIPRIQRANPQRFMPKDEAITQVIDDEAEVRVPFIHDMERNPLIGFGAKTGRPVQFMYSRWDGTCKPVQKKALEVAMFVTDPRVVYGYKEDGTPITLDEQRGFHSLVYVPRSDDQFEREFGVGEYERLGRCEAKVGGRIPLTGGAEIRIKEVRGVKESGNGPDPLIQAQHGVVVEGKPADDGEYVMIAVDGQERPHFPVRYAPLRWSPADGGGAGTRVKAGEYAVRGELRAVEVWHRPWKKVTVKGYAREVRVEGK